MYDDHAGYYDNIRKAIKEYTKELHMHQKYLKKIYAVHNETVEEFKKVVEKFAKTCAIRHNSVELKDVGNITGLPKIKPAETSFTSLNLSRIGVLTLIKKLSDEIKAKPNCNKFTITINTDVTKG
jgi:pyruvate-formate lyase